MTSEIRRPVRGDRTVPKRVVERWYDDCRWQGQIFDVDSRCLPTR